MALDNLLAAGSSASITSLWPVLCISLTVALVSTWFVRKLALKFNVVDKPDNLVKTHTRPVPYLGGVAIFLGFTAGVVTAAISLSNRPDSQIALRYLLAVFAPALVISAVGLADDVLNISPRNKIIGQFAAALVLVLIANPQNNYLAEPLGIKLPASLGLVITAAIALIFVLGATNSVNLLDGIDGLCGAVTAVMAAAMIALAAIMHHHIPDHQSPFAVAALAAALLGGIAGFLPFNKHPASIFMGDAGSLFIGFVFAAMMTLLAAVHPKWALSAIIIFAVPILDTAVAFARRWLNKRPLFVSDRGHIYDQMMDRGIPLKRTVLLCCVLAGVYSAVGLAISRLDAGWAVAACVLVVVISAVVVWKRGFLKMTGLRGTVPQNRVARDP